MNPYILLKITKKKVNLRHWSVITHKKRNLYGQKTCLFSIRKRGKSIDIFPKHYCPYKFYKCVRVQKKRMPSWSCLYLSSNDKKHGKRIFCSTKKNYESLFFGGSKVIKIAEEWIHIFCWKTPKNSEFPSLVGNHA